MPRMLTEMEQSLGEPDAAQALRALLLQHFKGLLSKPVLKCVVEVVCAVVRLSANHRGWSGRLSLWGIARAMSTQTTVKACRKRLGRLLCNRNFDIDSALLGLVTLSGVRHWGTLVPILLDQTSLCKDTVQAIVASFQHSCRSIPIAILTFESSDLPDSQTELEWRFIERLLGRLRAVALAPILVMDRGYAKLTHMRRLISAGAEFVIRGCRTVVVEYGDCGGTHKMALGRLPHKSGKAVRYCNVKYRDDAALLVDIIVYRERGFEEPWFLIVPPGSEARLSTAQVVEWYRSRMRIETTFRDFKSCLGLRKGLLFVNDKPSRMARIMFCLCIAYMVLLAVNLTTTARRARKRLEVRRRYARHGTTRTLSALSVALLTITQLLESCSARFGRFIQQLLTGWTNGLFSPAFDAIDL